MRRAAILELMATLGMKGMRAAYDEVLAEAAASILPSGSWASCCRRRLRTSGRVRSNTR